MIRPDPRAGGCFLSMLIVIGFFGGLALGNPVAGTLVGTGVGILVALLVWITDRGRKKV